MSTPTVPKSADHSPMIYGFRRYMTGLVVENTRVIYEFNDDTCGVQIRLRPSDGAIDFFKDMQSGDGEKLITADMACGDTPEDIEIHTDDRGQLDLLRRSIEWFYYDDEITSLHRKVLRMFYTRVRKALVAG